MGPQVPCVSDFGTSDDFAHGLQGGFMMTCA